MSRHRLPLARPDRDADLIAPVITRRPDTHGSDVDGPVRSPDAPDITVPAPRRAAGEARAGRHAAGAEPESGEAAGRHRIAAPVPAPAPEPADTPEETPEPAPARTTGHHRLTPENPTAIGERAGRRRAEKAGVQAATGGRRRADASEQPTDVVASDGTAQDGTEVAGQVDAAVLPEPSRSRHAADAPSRRHRRTDTRPADARPAGRRHATLRGANRRRSALVLVTVAAGLLALPTVSSASADQCRWQRAAHNLLVALGNRSDDRSDALRTALTQAGVGPQLPAECAQRPAQAGATSTTQPTTQPTTTSATRPTSSKPTAPATTTTSAAAPTTTSRTTKPQAAAPAAPGGAAAAGTGSGSTAAGAFGWGTPAKSDDFSGGLGGWGVYNGAGHGGNGRRTPDAAKVADGVLTITGDSNGNSAGMAWGDGQKYGRWEARVRSTVGDDSYHPVMLLWPDAENWPVGGEVDWMEISSADRQNAETFLHYGSNNNQVSGNVEVDATQWHNWAVEWSPQGITTYLDGKVWWKTTNTSILPPGPMHMTIQLDYFGGGNPKTSQMMVDWVHQYKM